MKLLILFLFSGLFLFTLGKYFCLYLSVKVEIPHVIYYLSLLDIKLLLLGTLLYICSL